MSYWIRCPLRNCFLLICFHLCIRCYLSLSRCLELKSHEIPNSTVDNQVEKPVYNERNLENVESEVKSWPTVVKCDMNIYAWKKDLVD